MNFVRSAEIITVGTELLLGEIVDTNSARVAADLAAAGVDVYWSQRVGDNLGRIAAALHAGLGRSDLVVLTGGLGPTDDDLTRDAVARVVGEEQSVDPELEAWLRARFARGGRQMPPSNLRQAHVIPSAEVLPNPIGTAPGWLVRVEREGGKRYVVTLPGPPRELERMWRQEALPRLPLPHAKLFVHTFKTIGVGESSLAEALGELTLGANPSVATYAKADGVHVRVAAKADDLESAEALALPTLAAVARKLGDSVWGTNGDELPGLVLTALRESRKRVAIAEGVTGGALTAYLLNADDDARAKGGKGADFGASRPPGAVSGSVVACDPETMRALGVPAQLLLKLPFEAAQVVVALAAAVRAFFKADLGIANLGPCIPALAASTEPNYVEPSSTADTGSTSGAPPLTGAARGAALGRGATPDEAERRVTRVVIGLASDSGTSVRTIDLPPLGGPWQRERTAFTSLHLLRSALR